MVETPVLFITFVRPYYARQVWNAIVEAQPKTLYFYSNKGRPEKAGEIECNNEIRSWVNEIDWDCDLHTWFRDECVDVYTSLKGAISWLFDNEERGIILEDDCVPSKAFWGYCDSMLERFNDEKSVWYISGDNFIEQYSPQGYDVFFTRYKWIFGWACWKDRWDKINWDSDFIKGVIYSDIYKQIYGSRIQSFLYQLFVLKMNKRVMIEEKCWDYVLGLNIDASGGVVLCPAKNLVTNVGSIGTHNSGGKSKSAMVDCPSYNEDTYDIKNIYPYFVPNFNYEKKLFYYVFIKPNLSLTRVVKFLKLVKKKFFI